MDKFTTLTAVAAPLPRVNVDTDAIIPKQYLKTIKRTGLGKGLFAEMRYKDDGSDEPGIRAEQARLQERQDHRRRRQFRLRLLARARALGAHGLRHHPASSPRASPTSSTTTASRTASCRSIVSPEDLEKLMDDASRGANATLTSTSRSRRSAGRTAAW